MKLFGVIRDNIKAIGGTIFAVGAITGMTITVVNYVHDQEDKLNEVLMRTEDTQGMIIEIAKQQNTLKDTVERIEKKVTENSYKLNRNFSMMEFERRHRDEFTKEQMDAILEEIKKNREPEYLIIAE